MIKKYEDLYDENGNYKTDEKYKEILKLDKMLTEANIPHTLDKRIDGWQICYPVEMGTGKCICDAIEFNGSYGSDADLLEIMGLLTEEEKKDYSTVRGWLTAENVFERMKAHYEGIGVSNNGR